MKELTLAAKAFADPSRVRIIMALRAGELCVCELCDALGVTQSTLSTHLQVIREAGLVSARREGKWMYYAIAPAVKPLVRSLFRFFAKSLETDPILKRDKKELSQRLALRTAGSCCIGFGTAKRPQHRYRPPRGRAALLRGLPGRLGEASLPKKAEERP